MAWRLAKSLETLRAEVNAAFPDRSKASDGTLGDAAHRSRPSRHNPNDLNVVCAIDITHDPAHGCDIHAIARELVKHPHPNLEYVISNAQVAKRRTGFRWEPYTGSNAHRQHAHFAVGQGPDSEPTPPYDDTDTWGIASVSQEDEMTPEQWTYVQGMNVKLDTILASMERDAKLEGEELTRIKEIQATQAREIAKG